MFDWAQLSGFDWDEGNARKNASKHDVAQSEAEQVFFNQPLIVTQDPKHSQNEARYHALGITDERRQLHVSFTLRTSNTLIRIISARDMHRKERRIYEQAKEDT
ncbi:MAG: BrnT family toxin [Proteobacteria bacterium]|nr:BrnT family toxin [Pseudomonadota bacterium]